MPKGEGKAPRRRPASRGTSALLGELVSHFRETHETLRREWIAQMTAKGLLAGLTKAETESESIAIYDTCVECLESGEYQAAEEYARRMAERDVVRGMTGEQIFGRLLTLRDVYGRSLLERYGRTPPRLLAALSIYEPVANKILSVVAMAVVEEQKRVVRQQQEAILELSTPALQLRPGLLILPIIGVLDSVRAKQLTEQLLRAIRAHRASAVVLDITGVPAVDSKVANHLLQTVEASRLMGAQVIVTGLTPETAQTVVTIGVDLSRLTTKSDLQGGIEAADRLLGYRVIMADEASQV